MDYAWAASYYVAMFFFLLYYLSFLSLNSGSVELLYCFPLIYCLYFCVKEIWGVWWSYLYQLTTFYLHSTWHIGKSFFFHTIRLNDYAHDRVTKFFLFILSRVSIWVSDKDPMNMEVWTEVTAPLPWEIETSEISDQSSCWVRSWFCFDIFSVNWCLGKMSSRRVTLGNTQSNTQTSRENGINVKSRELLHNVQCPALERWKCCINQPGFSCDKPFKLGISWAGGRHTL